jgi:hypothetical protein
VVVGKSKNGNNLDGGGGGGNGHRRTTDNTSGIAPVAMQEEMNDIQVRFFSFFTWQVFLLLFICTTVPQLLPC